MGLRWQYGVYGWHRYGIGGPIGAGIGAFAGLGMSMMNSEKAKAAEAAIAGMNTLQI